MSASFPDVVRCFASRRRPDGGREGGAALQLTMAQRAKRVDSDPSGSRKASARRSLARPCYDSGRRAAVPVPVTDPVKVTVTETEIPTGGPGRGKCQ